MGHMRVMGSGTLFIGHKRSILLVQAKGNTQGNNGTQTKHNTAKRTGKNNNRKRHDKAPLRINIMSKRTHTQTKTEKNTKQT